ncbi:hypothetical protein C8R42DRAFT_228738 [Lentinula raphanica]|nr:hypothetical protein C8R42DRAFT_228738 [Lentinula raphanica]
MAKPDCKYNSLLQRFVFLLQVFLPHRLFSTALSHLPKKGTMSPNTVAYSYDPGYSNPTSHSPLFLLSIALLSPLLSRQQSALTTFLQRVTTSIRQPTTTFRRSQRDLLNFHQILFSLSTFL